MVLRDKANVLKKPMKVGKALFNAITPVFYNKR